MTDNIIVLEYGSPAALEILKARASELAAVLVEPVQSRRPELQPARVPAASCASITEAAGYRADLRRNCHRVPCAPRRRAGAVRVRADLATYGKVVGGGLPIGLVAGYAKYLDALDGGRWAYGDDVVPEVGVTFFAGTFVRHPLALAAAQAVLLHLKRRSRAAAPSELEDHQACRHSEQRCCSGRRRRAPSRTSARGFASTSRSDLPLAQPLLRLHAR